MRLGPFRSHLGSERGSWALRGALGALLGPLGLLLGTLGGPGDRRKSRKLVFLATVVIFKGPLGTTRVPHVKHRRTRAGLLYPSLLMVLRDKA